MATLQVARLLLVGQVGSIVCPKGKGEAGIGLHIRQPVELNYPCYCPTYTHQTQKGVSYLPYKPMNPLYVVTQPLARSLLLMFESEPVILPKELYALHRMGWILVMTGDMRVWPCLVSCFSHRFPAFTSMSIVCPSSGMRCLQRSMPPYADMKPVSFILISNDAVLFF